jgi:hypothetical protein
LSVAWSLTEPGYASYAKKIVWEIERKLIEDDALPILFYTRAANCREPYLEALTTRLG